VAALLDQFRGMNLHAVRCLVRSGDEFDRFFASCGLGPSEYEIRQMEL
jgi:hypothetical protein